MSDPKYGEPVDDNTSDQAESVDDVVGRAHEGLAEAEAASRDAVTEDELAAADADGAAAGTPGASPEPGRQATTDQPAAAAPAGPSDDDLEAAYAEAGYTPGAGDRVEPARADADYAAEPAAESHAAEPPAATVAAPAVDSEPLYRGAGTYDTATYGEAVTPSEPVATGAAAGAATTAYATPQPIFVQAPEAPRPRGNRGAAGAIGLLAALAFGVLYLAAALTVGLVDGSVTGEDVAAEALGALTSWWFWVPVAVFFLGFWLLGAILNRGRWGYWVIFGLIVGFIAYAGHLLGQLFQAPFWTLTASQGADLVAEQAFAPLAIAAFIVGRELTIWFGAWVAARGRRVTELNYEAQREYERTLEAGPQLHQG